MTAPWRRRCRPLRRSAPARLFIASLCALTGSLQAGAAAEPLTADALPPALLADCDARAEPFGRYAPSIAGAAAALIDIGAAAERDFEDAKIGFCSLREAGGPVAATSCEDGIVLLDEKFAAASQTLNLRATLAHEMTHHLQHRARKARFGAAYCASARYGAEKPAFEAQADAVGDKVAALFVRGRGVEIVNACDAPVSVYLEADDPVAARGAEAAFQRVPARSRVMAAEKSLSGRFGLYARTAPQSGRVHVWRDAQSDRLRFVEGRAVRLRAMRLSAPARLDAPFRIRLSCPGGPG